MITNLISFTNNLLSVPWECEENIRENIKIISEDKGLGSVDEFNTV